MLVEQNARAALRLASRGYVVENGRVVQHDRADTLLHDDHVRAAYLGVVAPAAGVPPPASGGGRVTLESFAQSLVFGLSWARSMASPPRASRWSSA